MVNELHVGLRAALSLRVDEHLVVPAVSPAFTGFADMPPVFATAYMIGFIEWTCIEALRPYLTRDQRTVGTHVDVSHVAATPIGMMVMANAELTSIRGKRLGFEVTCHDEAGLIGKGYHERALIDHANFLERVVKKGAEVRV